MSAFPSPIRQFSCPSCQSKLPYDASLAGQKRRCGKCGATLVVPAPQELARAGEVATAPAVEPTVEFWCPKCDTRMVARAEDAGKKAKCPECYAIHVVPAPRVIHKRNEPAAMQGPQYGVWEVNQAPLPEQQRAKQAQLFPVYCRVCDTLMYAQPKHVGAKLKCPDCGALTLVKPPPKQVEKKSPLVPAGQEYKLDPKEQAVVRPVREDLVKLQEKSRREVEEAARRREAELPPMPPLPTMQGVWPMLLAEPVTTFWVGLTAAWLVTAWLLDNSFVPNGASGYAQIFALFCRIAGCLAFVLSYGPSASIWCAIVAESSEGLKKMQATPAVFFINCALEMAHIGFALAISFIPGFALIKFAPVEVWAAVGGGSWVLVFPVLLLSSFQEDSPFGIFSPKVWGSLVLRPLHWFVFYAQSALLTTGVAVSVAGLIRYAPEWSYAAIPISLAGAFIYFRILGRFAWWLAESLATEEAPHRDGRYQRFQ